jgi:hypothetical protein
MASFFDMQGIVQPESATLSQRLNSELYDQVLEHVRQVSDGA